MKYFTKIKDQWMEKNGEMQIFSLGYLAYLITAAAVIWLVMSLYLA